MANESTHLEHLGVGPCDEDDAVDAKNAEDDVVRGDGVEPSAEPLERPWRLPVSAHTPRSTSMRGAE
jgi:hypothetical protein